MRDLRTTRLSRDLGGAAAARVPSLQTELLESDDPAQGALVAPARLWVSRKNGCGCWIWAWADPMVLAILLLFLRAWITHQSQPQAEFMAQVHSDLKQLTKTYRPYRKRGAAWHCTV